MASTSPPLLRPQLLLLFFVFLVIGPAAGDVDCDPSEVNDMVSSGQVGAMATATRGIKASLIHRSHYSLRRSTTEADGSRSSANSLAGDVRRSHQRSERLGSRIRNERLLGANAPSSSPAGQPADWESPLSPDTSAGEYNMEISLGTPPQTFVVIADTGSDLAWVQCLPLESSYNQTDSPFDPSKSSTYARLSCASSACEFLSTSDECVYSSSAQDGSDCFFYYTYGTGAINGTLAEDTIHIDTMKGGVQSVPNFSFGCSHNATADFVGADGLFGLGRGEISFPSQLGQYFGSVFSYCLVNTSRRESETSPLIFGEDALSATAANGSRLQFQFTPMINVSGNPTYYFVNAKGITVDGVAASIPAEAFEIAEDGSGTGTFFDSGTTIASFVDEAFDPFIDLLKSKIAHYERLSVEDSLELTGNSSELCYNATWETWISEYGKTVPPVSFNFANASTFDLGVGNVWEDSGEGSVCMTIGRSTDGLNVIGNIQMVDHNIVYDLENQRIGFVTAVCES